MNFVKISLYAVLPLLALASCDSKQTDQKKTCALYDQDKIDAVEALIRLDLQANENGGRFEPVERLCSSFR